MPAAQPCPPWSRGSGRGQKLPWREGGEPPWTTRLPRAPPPSQVGLEPLLRGPWGRRAGPHPYFPSRKSIRGLRTLSASWAAVLGPLFPAPLTWHRISDICFTHSSMRGWKLSTRGQGHPQGLFGLCPSPQDRVALHMAPLLLLLGGLALLPQQGLADHRARRAPKGNHLRPRPSSSPEPWTGTIPATPPAPI